MQSRGFIALISVLILSVILLAAVISLAQYGITSRYALLTLESKTITEELAHACVQVVRIAIFNDNLYKTSNHVIPIGNSNCIIKDIFTNTPTQGVSRIEASASLSGATTNLQVDVQVSTGEIVRTLEVPTL
jgi:Tfp pilus assembly protein PilV